MKRRRLIAVAALAPFSARAAASLLKIGSPAGPFGEILGFAIQRAQRFVAIYRSPEVKAFVLDHYDKYITPVW